MKQIFLMIFFVFGLAYAQQKIPLISETVDMYADSISESISIGKNSFPAQIWIESGRTLTVNVQYSDGTNWYWLHDPSEDAAWVATIDSTINNVIPLPPWLFYAGKTIRFLFDNDIADTLSIPVDKRPY